MKEPHANYPELRLDRQRRTPAIRRLLAAPPLPPAKWIWPIFVVDGRNRREPIPSLSGQYRVSIDQLEAHLAPAVEAGIGGVLLFGQEEGTKDPNGCQAWNPKGTVQKAVGHIKQRFPQIAVATDVCLCAYTDHGHCGALAPDGTIDNPLTCDLLARIARSHAEAGADIVAPSAMADGQVRAIRAALSEAGLDHTLVMAYSTKFASTLYGPFRDAERSAPTSGDRRAYQADPFNPRAALLESALDEAEGADILMVKPATPYLDLLAELRRRTDLPIALYHVSGEYAMAQAAAEKGWLDLPPFAHETAAAFARAGADIIISYWAGRYTELFA